MNIGELLNSEVRGVLIELDLVNVVNVVIYLRNISGDFVNISVDFVTFSGYS